MARTSRIKWLAAAAVAAALAGAQTMQRGPARSPHGRLSMPCVSCHTATSWSPLRAIPEFNHNQETRYPLRGMHETVECRVCHTRLVFSEAGTRCADCHADIHRRQFGARCEDCHTVKGWRTGTQAVRNHSVRFPLIGAHASVDCEACHRGAAAAQFTGLSVECVSCHQREYDRAATVNHRAAGFPAACSQCHGMDGWRAVNFDHGRFTAFALIGPHARLDCASCHIGNRFRGTPADCFACHAKDFQAARNPDHAAAGFPRDCALCHTSATWTGARFDHGAATQFPLTGAHTGAACASCHVAGRFAGTPKDCFSCHAAAFQATSNPDHRKGNFPTDCSRCHTTGTWAGASFDHSITRFALTGAHLRVECARCHPGNNYSGAQAQCAGCHLADFNRTRNPNHAAAGFPQDCSVCHTTAQWSGARFDHNAATRFPLTGAHGPLACSQCHTDRFAGTPSECSGCHLDAFNRTTNPNHPSAGFPQTCAVCHNSSAWTPASFDHGRTSFPLTGAHLKTECGQCHTGNRFAGTPAQCAACHLPEFNRTTNPNHPAAGFPQDCSVCHSTAQWPGARFDHSRTRFPLTGAHAPAPCASCHASGKFAGLDAACAACHLDRFNTAANPNHRSAGFPTQCEVCHSTSAWTPASFDHSRTRFQLTGGHVRVPCASCHVNGVFAGTPSDCVACHRAQYQSVTNPNHIAAGFPTTCATCHNTTSWSGAQFSHNRFPIYTGAHARRWSSCNECHVNPADYQVFSCITCHEHEKNNTDRRHREVRNYVYNATSCYSCHPAGRGD